MTVGNLPEIGDYKRWQATLTDATRYLNVIKDAIPHNREIARHTGMIDRIRVEIDSLVSLMEHGG